MDSITIFQVAQAFFGEDAPMALQIITYIITGVIGGVLYKYFNRWLTYAEKTKSTQQEASDNLINNLEQRIQALGERITDLESKREESYERELELTKMLAKAEQKVESLTEKVETLERNQEIMSSSLDKYYKRYGPLDEIEQGTV